MTSTYVIITLCCARSDGTFYNFSVTLNVKLNYAKNYENWLNFVKVMLKILAVPFFSEHGVQLLLAELKEMSPNDPFWNRH